MDIRQALTLGLYSQVHMRKSQECMAYPEVLLFNNPSGHALSVSRLRLPRRGASVVLGVGVPAAHE